MSSTDSQPSLEERESDDARIIDECPTYTPPTVPFLSL